MEWEHIEINWAQFKTIIQRDWDKLTDEQLEVIAGRRDYLVRKIQAVYGFSKPHVEVQLTDWQESQINIDGHFYQTKSFSVAQSLR